tara:strand:- start:8026 stop:8823 length:798 start_codon:yes stop_codon:yes gene_type:complete
MDTVSQALIIFLTVTLLICVLQIINAKKDDPIFEKTYLINLDRRPDRLERFMKTFEASDASKMQLTKISAVDGGELDISKVPLSEVARGELKQIETTGFRSKHYQLTRGAIGCYLSHVKVWRDVVDNNHRHGLIFEDDVNVPSNIYHKMEKSMKHIPEDWDIILFGYHCKDCENMKGYRKVKRFILLHCYAISYSGIIKILKTNSLFPITQQIDSYLSELSEDILNIYTVPNPIIHQNGSRTDIQMPIIKQKNVDVNDRLAVQKK